MSNADRLGRNHGRYLGETIDISALLRDVVRAATSAGWQVESFPESGSIPLVALRRSWSPDAPKVYLSTGIHGDEPAGPAAVRRLFDANLWPEGMDIWLCPCLNPTGFPLNRRENAEGIDLNRQYLNTWARETKAHIAWLKEQPRFDVTLCLHEDWEANGFYLYELNPERRASFAEAIIDAVNSVCPIDLSPEIEGRSAQGGIIRPSTDPRSRPDWPEAFYLLTNKTSLSYTLEAPSDFQLATRVSALVAAVRTVLSLISTK